MKLSYESHLGIGKALTDKDTLAADKLIRDHILRIAERLPKNARLAIVKKAFSNP
jgi:DNA-binding GntR family transcriptional regulator